MSELRRRLMLQEQNPQYITNIDGVVRTDIQMPLGTTFGFKVLLRAGWTQGNNNYFGLGFITSWPERKCVSFYSSGVYNGLICIVCDGNSSTTNCYIRAYHIVDNIDQYIEFDMLSDICRINGRTVYSLHPSNGTRSSTNKTLNIFNIKGNRESQNFLSFAEFYIRDSNGNMIHDLFPKKKNNSLGIIDKITGVFYAGDGEFQIE